MKLTLLNQPTEQDEKIANSFVKVALMHAWRVELVSSVLSYHGPVNYRMVVEFTCSRPVSSLSSSARTDIRNSLVNQIPNMQHWLRISILPPCVPKLGLS